MPPVKTLREYAAAHLAEVSAEYGPPSDLPQAIDRWVHHLIATCQVPDDILEALPEVSRHNEPQFGPQEYECGCVTMVRVTDRNSCSWLGPTEKPFEMRLVLPCNGTSCALDCKTLGITVKIDHDGKIQSAEAVL